MRLSACGMSDEVENLKVRLLARDSKMPNIAIMKVSTYWKSLGADVDWYDPIFDSRDTDILYESQIFDFTEPYYYYPENADIYIGGTGVNIERRLPSEIDSIVDLDYSIYPEHLYSMQFYSRGCVRNCSFCIVRQKEGYIYPTSPMTLNPSGKHIEILDNNFFANPQWRDAYADIMGTGLPVKLHGVDARIIDEEQADALNSMRMVGRIHIAWDFPQVDMIPKLTEITKLIKPYKLTCYVLIGYNSTPEQDLYRVESLRSLGIDPFVMPYNKKDVYQRRFARWVNMKAVFKSVRWEDYK